MAKRKTTTTRRKRRSKKKQNEFDIYALLRAWDALKNDPRFWERSRKTGALTLMLVSIFTLLACLSYFFTGNIDQSVAETGAERAMQARNWMGFLGASIADLLVRRGFGLLSLLIPLYALLLGLMILERSLVHLSRRLFKYVLFSLLWGSALLAFISLLAQLDQPLMGGGFGHFLNMWLFAYVGRIGMGFLLIFSFAMFIVLNFDVDIPAAYWFQKLGIRLDESERQKRNREKRKAKQKATAKPSLRQRIQQFIYRDADFEDVEAKNTQKEEQTNETQNQSESSTQEEEPNSSPLTHKEVKANVGSEISFDLPDEKSNKESYKKEKTEKEGDGLELVIDEGVEEKTVEEKTPIEQVGDDNIHKTGDDTYEKIVSEEDKEKAEIDEVGDWEQYDPTRELSRYEYPGLELLEEHGSGKSREVNRDELEANKNRIVKTLGDYKIEIRSIKATIGPTVTLYEIVPAPGVRISKIRNLEDDIALSLAALGIRIIAPMPGKGTIGIEIPNSKREIVSLKGVLATERFQHTRAELPIAIGRTISNEVFISDLNKMPHLLIAGATGQGKSVGLNTVIASLLFKKHPAHVKFVLIDPKKVEMSLYQSLIYHFLAQMPSQEEPIITDTVEAIRVLKSLCIEMDDRYNLLKAAKVRNLKEYNEKFLKRRLNPKKGHRYLPYIVLVIDELADMMMMAGKEVEMPIARLAQLARAVGIHLVVATQRPSVNVITGIIKANFPARLSYRVISKVDSRTILDANGADQLIGRGDMLLSTGSEVIRLQNAFIDTPEVEQLVNHISKQQGFPEPYFLPELPTDGELEDDEPFEKDDMFPDAARLVVRHQQGSASLIQRKLKLGYNRAGRIIDQLEKAGIVGPHSGSKARDVLVSTDTDLEQYLRDL